MDHRRTYELHGIGIGLEAISPAWAEAVDEILAPYRVSPGAPPDLFARMGPAGRERPGAHATVAGRFEDLVFHRDGEDRLWIDVHGAGWVEIHLPERRIECRLDLDPERDAWVVAHHALYPALLELLKDRGLYPAHSGAVAQAGDGLLLCGRSGSGKTTLTLALAHAGWDLLSDDTCFLERKEGEIRCKAFWEDVHVTQETIDRFPQLGFLAQQPLRHANHKKHFRVADLPAVTPAADCRPRWLVFPRVDPDATASRLTPLTGVQALQILTPQSLIPLRPATTERHLEHLAALVGQVSALELAMGPDLDEVVATLSTHLS